MYNLKDIGKTVTDTAVDVGGYLRKEQKKLKRSKIETKSLHSYVSYIDREAEQELVRCFQNLIPEAGFVVEEQTITKTGEVYNWIIDPLDGTTNYIHKLSPYASASLCRKIM